MKDLMDRTIDELKAKAAENGQHPRTLIVATATAAMGHAVYQVEEKYDLTTIEPIQCLAEIMRVAKRSERSPRSEVE